MSLSEEEDSSSYLRVWFLSMTAHPLANCLLARAVIVPVVPLLVVLQESEPASPFGRGPLIVLVKELSPVGYFPLSPPSLMISNLLEAAV